MRCSAFSSVTWNSSFLRSVTALPLLSTTTASSTTRRTLRLMVFAALGAEGAPPVGLCAPAAAAAFCGGAACEGAAGGVTGAGEVVCGGAAAGVGPASCAAIGRQKTEANRQAAARICFSIPGRLGKVYTQRAGRATSARSDPRAFTKSLQKLYGLLRHATVK